jgi:phosphate transport system permease protein
MNQQDTRKIVEAGLRRRHRREHLFRLFGVLATAVGVIFLGVFFATLVGNGASAFLQTHIELDVEFSQEILAPGGEPDLQYADYDALVRSAIWRLFPEVTDRRERRALSRLVSVGAGYRLRDEVAENLQLIGTTRRVSVPAAANVDMFVKGRIERDTDADQRMDRPTAR